MPSQKTKLQLNRNFVVNPEVSPTPEEERSSPDNGSLPELIVEPAPNLHDDPPEFYEGLERRMKQYYRELFLGAHGSDDDISCDFEVNRSMASTPKLDIDTGKDKAKVSEDSSQNCHKVSSTIVQIHEPRPERPQMAQSGSPVLTPGFTQFGRVGRMRTNRYKR